MNAQLRPQAGPHPSPTYRPMRVIDLPAVMAIEATAYSHPWSGANFIDSLAAGYHADLCLASDGGLLGYFVVMPGFEEAHLLNITVAPAQQRAGLGAALLQRVLAQARQRGDQALWLEVRPSNTAARALYRRFSFVQVGCRRNYYPADHQKREDALVLQRLLNTAGNGGLHALV